MNNAVTVPPRKLQKLLPNTDGFRVQTVNNLISLLQELFAKEAVIQGVNRFIKCEPIIAKGIKSFFHKEIYVGGLEEFS